MIILFIISQCIYYFVCCVSFKSSPFLMEVKEGDYEGNKTYRGYIVDLLDEVKRKASFEYDITLSPDGTFGREISPGNWSGTINEVIQKVKIDLRKKWKKNGRENFDMKLDFVGYNIIDVFYMMVHVLCDLCPLLFENDSLTPPLPEIVDFKPETDMD